MFYEYVFSRDQKSFRGNIINKIIIEREFKASPTFSLRDIEYFSMISKFYSDRINYDDLLYLSSFYKGEYSNYNIKLINVIHGDFIDVKIFKNIIEFLFEIRYSEYMQHENEEWMCILYKEINLILYLSVQKYESRDEFYFRIGTLELDSPNNAPPSTGPDFY